MDGSEEWFSIFFIVERVYFCQSIIYIRHESLFYVITLSWLIWNDHQKCRVNSAYLAAVFDILCNINIFACRYDYHFSWISGIDCSRDYLIPRYTYILRVWCLKCRMHRERDIQLYYRDAHRLEFPIYLRDICDLIYNSIIDTIYAHTLLSY